MSLYNGSPQTVYGHTGNGHNTGHNDQHPKSQERLDPTQFEISVSCKNLADVDRFTKSDPFCVMFWLDSGGVWGELGRTEVIMNKLDPSWKSKFMVQYCPGVDQRVKFEVYDWDCLSHKLKRHDFLARLECSLQTIVNAPGKQYISCIKDGPSKKGKFVIIAEEQSVDKDVVKMQFAASHLDKKDFFGKSDPYFILSRATGNGQWTVVAKSSIVYNTLEPTWPLITVPVRDLCNGDYARQLKMDVYDHDEHTKDDLIGTLKVTLKDLTTAVGQRTRFPCVNPSKMSKRNYSDSGKVTLSFFKLEAKINFKTSL